MTSKEQLHRLVDALPESEHERVCRVLLALVDDPAAVTRVADSQLDVAEDDESETEAEREAVQEARSDVAAVRVHSLRQVRRTLGL